MLTARKADDERGAYAVLYAMFVVVMFGIAALAVDIGNTMARKSDIQGQADFAALAGGSKLTSSALTSIPIDVANAAADSLNANEAADRGCDPCVTGAHLIDGSLTNGEIQLTTKGLRVLVPKERVTYGFARVLDPGAGYSDLQTSATVQIFSPGSGAMPMYASAGCDFGLQTLTDPASGHVTSTHGNLAFPDDASSPDLEIISHPSPPTIPVQTAAPYPSLTVAGQGFTVAAKGPKPASKVTHVGFFLNDGATMHTQAVDPVESNETTAHITSVPAEVAATEEVWWVRVYLVEDGQTTGVWSPAAEALPLQVGSAQLECEAGSTDGNFGTLRMPRTDVPSGDDLAMNIAVSFQDPLTLVVHKTWVPGGLCSDGTNGAVESKHTLKPGTNCVGTDPGLAANAAAAGLIEGVGSTPGRLDKPTTCGEDVTLVLHKSFTINGDTLDCFLDDSVTVSTITSPSYPGPAVLDEAIYSSPRFAWVPVLAPDPNRGTSQTYSIIDFRPAFITELNVDNKALEQVKVVFFNWRALPSQTDGPVETYFGVGPKILRLVD